MQSLPIYSTPSHLTHPHTSHTLTPHTLTPHTPSYLTHPHSSRPHTPHRSSPAVGQCWFEFNDTHVSPIPARHIDKVFQGKQSAYMLFYRRKAMLRPAEGESIIARNTSLCTVMCIYTCTVVKCSI